MSIQDLIASAGDRLTPTDRRIAEVVLEEPTLLAFGTVSDLAGRVDTSRPSIVRFATRLGFDGYVDLQKWAQEQVSERLSRPIQRIHQRDEGIGPVRAAVENAVHSTFETLERERVDTLAAPIVGARNVWIVSGETSMAGAHALYSGLSMVRAGVGLVEEHSTGRDLCGANHEDCAVVFDFQRYRSHSVTAARSLSERGVTVVAVTDGPLSPLVPLSEAWCELKIPAVGLFDSSVPVVLAAELIVARVVRMLGEPVRERIDRLESMWQASGTFLHYRPRDSRGV